MNLRLPVTYPTPERDVLPTGMQLWPMHDAMATWMQHIDFATLTEMWWEAQRRRAEREEKQQRRTNDPADMFGKGCA